MRLPLTLRAKIASYFRRTKFCEGNSEILICQVIKKELFSGFSICSFVALLILKRFSFTNYCPHILQENKDTSFTSIFVLFAAFYFSTSFSLVFLFFFFLVINIFPFSFKNALKRSLSSLTSLTFFSLFLFSVNVFFFPIFCFHFCSFCFFFFYKVFHTIFITSLSFLENLLSAIFPLLTFYIFLLIFFAYFRHLSFSLFVLFCKSKI